MPERVTTGSPFYTGEAADIAAELMASQSWQPDPRTVAAVVEFIRNDWRFAGMDAEIVGPILERFNLSPSQEPGGTDGQ